ncbi:hypothetical protein [Gardnerella sp. KA00735]|uniref:hypothetical protein n=1 Tax=unclassified Gardnerella TaxID=2628112 RepID=UPI000C9F5199|nr:hypothetical protein [Gardnerella sp. KA00735]PNP88601.1 hypothetical protein BFS08_04425 [Gardnerella sp. KA00735]
MVRQVRIVNANNSQVQSSANRFSFQVPQEKDSQFKDAGTELKTSTWELENRHAIRSKQILEAVRKLDTTTNEAYKQQLIEYIDELYKQRFGGQLVALFAKCYIGYPYVDHYVSLDGNIVEHYKNSDTVPPLFQPARSLASSPQYAYIEIYSDGEVVPVAEDGTER